MSFDQIIRVMGRLATLATEFMSRVVALLNNETGEDFSDLIGDYIDRSAQEMALVACSAGKVRFIVAEIFSRDMGTMFFIRSGLPAHVSAHGFGLEEALYEPRKEALIEAFEQGNIVLIEDARSDSRTEYMRGIAWKFGIKSLFVVPLSFKHIPHLSFLLVLDVIDGDISDEKIAFLEKARSLIVETVETSYQSKVQLVSRLHHEIRNQSMPIGGFAERAKKKMLEPPEVERYMGIIIEKTQALEGLAKSLEESCRVIPISDSIH